MIGGRRLPARPSDQYNRRKGLGHATLRRPEELRVRLRSVRFCLLGAALLAAAAPAPAAAQEGSPAGPVPPQLLTARRARLVDALDGRIAIIGGDRLKDIEGDYPQDSDFRQDADFFYLTGLEEPDAWLVLNAGRPGAQALYLPPRDPANETWTGKRLGPGPEARRLSGVEDVRDSGRLDEDLAGWLSRGSRVVLVPGDDRNRALIAPRLSEGGAQVEQGAQLIHALRMVKDEDEIRRLRRAIAITEEAVREGWRVVEPGMNEYEVEAAIEYVFRSEGAERVGFPSIVGSGPNTTTLHYDKNRRRTEPGDLLLTDVGAEFGYYTADITRTAPVSGTFTPRQRALYDLVLGAQEAGLAAVRPGSNIGAAHGAAVAYLDAHSGDLCGSQSCSRYFVHGLSHWLGMDVHDVGGMMTPFQPGMVLTVEPGIYIEEEGLGIRIEDDVLVTPTGYELLSATLPREAEEIEALMRQEPRWIRPR
jgi:Xaa-Pro aminopeptidase